MEILTPKQEKENNKYYITTNKEKGLLVAKLLDITSIYVEIKENTAGEIVQRLKDVLEREKECYVYLDEKFLYFILKIAFPNVTFYEYRKLSDMIRILAPDKYKEMAAVSKNNENKGEKQINSENIKNPYKIYAQDYKKKFWQYVRKR